MLLIHEKSDHAWIKRVALGMVLIELVRVRFALCCDFMNVKTNWEGIIWFHLSLGRWWGPSLGWETSRGGSPQVCSVAIWCHLGKCCCSLIVY